MIYGPGEQASRGQPLGGYPLVAAEAGLGLDFLWGEPASTKPQVDGILDQLRT